MTVTSSPAGEHAGTRHTADSITSDALDELYQRLDRVRALHHPTGVLAATEHGNPPGCAVCGPYCWPCPTYQAVDAAEGNQVAEHEAVRQMDADPTQPHTGLVVQPYREHGVEKWVFRCWGSDTCDGWLGLGHHTQQSAERERDRHLAEDHKEQQ